MRKRDVHVLGEAILDLERSVDDGFLKRHGLAKGQSAQIEEARWKAILDDLPIGSSEASSGGSAANTAVAVQGFGGQAHFDCKVANDPIGRAFL